MVALSIIGVVGVAVGAGMFWLSASNASKARRDLAATRHAFAFLQRLGFVLASEQIATESFGNIVVRYARGTAFVEVIRDRSQWFCDIGINDRSASRFDLAFLLKCMHRTHDAFTLARDLESLDCLARVTEQNIVDVLTYLAMDFGALAADKRPLHIVYCSDRMLLTKRHFTQRSEIQDTYENYKASLGPMPACGVKAFFESDLGEESNWPFSRPQIDAFLSSPDETLSDNDHPDPTE